MIRWVVLGSVLALVAGIVVATGQQLPSTVASHFGRGGRADGFMSRDAYVAFMAAMAAGVPLLVALGGTLARWLPIRFVNLPNRDYWLAAERRAETTRAIEARLVAFACALAIFLCYTHWLVVEANAERPAQLDEGLFIGGLVAFFAFVAAWLATFYRRFRRPA